MADDVEWITVNGAHIPIKDGEDKGEAIGRFFDEKKAEREGGKIGDQKTLESASKQVGESVVGKVDPNGFEHNRSIEEGAARMKEQGIKATHEKTYSLPGRSGEKIARFEISKGGESKGIAEVKVNEAYEKYSAAGNKELGVIAAHQLGGNMSRIREKPVKYRGQG